MVTSVSHHKLRHRFNESIDMVIFRHFCQFHRWARPAEKGPSLFKVMYLSESVQMAPLAQSLMPGSWLPSGYRCQWPRSIYRPCYCHSIQASHQEARSWLCQNRVPSCSMSQSLPPTSLASPLSCFTSLGKLQGFLPRVTNSPNPNQQSPMPSMD